MRLNLAVSEEAPLFESSYTLGYQDMNLSNHLGNEKFIVLAQENFMRYSCSIGGAENVFFGMGIVVAAVKVQFLGQGFFGENISMRLWLRNRSSSGFQVFHQFIRDEVEIGRVEVDTVFFDYQNQRAATCPKEFIQFMDKLARKP